LPEQHRRGGFREVPQRQVDIEHRQPDRLGEKKLAMRDGRGGGEEIEREDQEAHPDRRDAHRGIVERALQRLDVEWVQLFCFDRHRPIPFSEWLQ
jgi:hypothetical protein